MNLIIDIGNTIAKMAVFDGGRIVEVVYDSNLTLERLPEVCRTYTIEKAIVATVIDLNERVLADLAALPFPLLWLNHETPLPVVNLYETPETLGYDRMAAVVGANEQFPHRNILVIDAGTCITYEFIDSKGQYHGGNISPGVQMRFRALHDYTAALPLCESCEDQTLLGRSTVEAIRQGVMNGIAFEIEGYIARLFPEIDALSIIFTGGDAKFFVKRIKNTIFAHCDLVFLGLNRILEYNASEESRR